MSRDRALEHLEHAEDSRLDPPARERHMSLAQIAATLYVGEQLERIATMLASGLHREVGDFGDDFYFGRKR